MHVTTHLCCGLLFRDLNSRSLFQLQTINNFTETRILKPQKLLLFYNIELFGQCKVHTFSLICFDIENIFETLKTFESIKLEIFCQKKAMIEINVSCSKNFDMISSDCHGTGLFPKNSTVGRANSASDITYILTFFGQRKVHTFSLICFDNENI